jgi:hypothetical protein
MGTFHKDQLTFLHTSECKWLNTYYSANCQLKLKWENWITFYVPHDHFVSLTVFEIISQNGMNTAMFGAHSNAHIHLSTTFWLIVKTSTLK